jgi:glycosyltransferase involved in cell wall biosynthesis
MSRGASSSSSSRPGFCRGLAVRPQGCPRHRTFVEGSEANSAFVCNSNSNRRPRLLDGRSLRYDLWIACWSASKYQLIDPKGRTHIQNPLVSVILIFFNAEKFLREAIESVYAQTYFHWELLLADDGSTDGSTAIAMEYAQKHTERVTYLEHPGHANRGACAARNLGIKSAKGKYLAFLDSDDVWLPDKLRQQVCILESNSSAPMVYGRDQWWYSWGAGATEGRDSITELGIPPDSVYDPPVLLTLSLRSKAPTPSPSNLLIRRDLVEEIGGFEEDFRGIYQMYEDHAFLAKVYLRVPVFVANECWIKYRRHPDSCMSKAERAGTKRDAGLYYLHWLADYMRNHGVTDRELLQAHKARTFRCRHPFLHNVAAKIRLGRRT